MFLLEQSCSCALMPSSNSHCCCLHPRSSRCLDGNWQQAIAIYRESRHYILDIPSCSGRELDNSKQVPGCILHLVLPATFSNLWLSTPRLPQMLLPTSGLMWEGQSHTVRAEGTHELLIQLPRTVCKVAHVQDRVIFQEASLFEFAAQTTDAKGVCQ